MERYPCSWTGRTIIVKMYILSKATYRFSEIPIKIPMACFIYRSRKNNPKIYMWPQKTLNSQSNPEKKNKRGGITLPDFKVYYKAKVIKTIWSWHKNRHIRPMKQNWDARNKPMHIINHYLTRGPRILKKNSLFKKKMLGESDIHI